MFSWDVAKALKNYEKHHVSFEEGSTVFDDPGALEIEDVKNSRRCGAALEATGRFLIDNAFCW